MEKLRIKKLTLLAMSLTLLIMIPCTLSFAQGKEAVPEKKEITIFTWPMGTTAYAIMYSLSDLVNKHSSWLRANIMSYSTPTEGIMNMQQMKEASLACVGTDGPAAIKGLSPYPKPMSSIKVIGSVFFVCNAFATLEPNVKSWADLKRKSVSSPSPAAAATTLIEVAFERCGVKPGDYKIHFMNYAKGVDALKANKLGACSAGGLLYPSKQLWLTNPATSELIASKPTYFVPVEPVDVEKTKEKSGMFGIGYISLPPGGIRGSDQPMSAYTMSIGLYCDEVLDARIVSELLKVWYEHFDEIKAGKPAAKFLSRDDMGFMAIPEGHWHPAAINFMREHKIPIK